ncbi:hypothetical protein, partial [Actinopolymorpha pittospori]
QPRGQHRSSRTPTHDQDIGIGHRRPPAPGPLVCEPLEMSALRMGTLCQATLTKVDKEYARTAVTHRSLAPSPATYAISLAR